MRSAFRGPAHQLAVRMRINNCTHGHNSINNNCPIANQPAMHHAPATVLAPRVCTLVPFILSAIILASYNWLSLLVVLLVGKRHKSKMLSRVWGVVVY